MSVDMEKLKESHELTLKRSTLDLQVQLAKTLHDSLFKDLCDIDDRLGKLRDQMYGEG